MEKTTAKQNDRDTMHAYIGGVRGGKTAQEKVRAQPKNLILRISIKKRKDSAKEKQENPQKRRSRNNRCKT